ncbi:sodium/potassium-transporting ATPase subunit alpha-2-like isoform X2 [Paramacrobiotus metropolitanus]|uniref:sodium/potassium-transporting ATPase subunit alpha-2-like isoform X2 n=1 Tax=Paramacrobiotus metropolitanus TaxID=2943436 RepID=UPI00244603D3|nr:sodium/potassium-transporting ATPase subunit alpha-2-like isoform X2 [Paramacrobiotus metropolitanus]
MSQSEDKSSTSMNLFTAPAARQHGHTFWSASDLSGADKSEVEILVPTASATSNKSANWVPSQSKVLSPSSTMDKQPLPYSTLFGHQAVLAPSAATLASNAVSASVNSGAKSENQRRELQDNLSISTPISTSAMKLLSPVTSFVKQHTPLMGAQESKLGMPLGGRRASFLDAPPVRLDRKATKEIKEKNRELQKAVESTKMVVARASQQLKETKQLDELKKELAMTEHMMTVDELCAMMEVDPEMGLSEKTVALRLVRDGPNALPPKKETPGWVLWAKQMTEGFSLLLWVGGLLAIIAYFIQNADQPHTPMDNLYLGIVLICVVFITATFSYAQEAKSSSIMNSFLKMAPQFASAVRNGEKKGVISSDLVVGDIVEIKAGDKIPADIRIVENRGLKVDNASLTGESEPLSRSVDGTDENPLETRNLAFFSTYAVEGSAIGIVVRTGERTIMGRIAKLAAAVETDLTPLAIEMHRFVKIMTCLAAFMGLLFFVIALAQGQNILPAFVFLIGVIVANVPEGILPATTVALALTAKRMARMNCLVKNLAAVETLGSTSVICSDKTGTLTQNRMTVAHLWVNNTIIECDTTEDQSKNIKVKIDSPTMKAVLRCLTLCNRAIFKPDQNSVHIMKRETIGDASESAMLKYTQIHVGDVLGYREKNRKVCEIPFNSTNKYQISIHESADYDGEYLLVMKGAPERIIERCDFVEFNGEAEPMSSEWMRYYDDTYDTIGGMGERIIGLAELRLLPKKFPRGFQFDSDKPNFPLRGLHFLGLVCLIDPPRAAVPNAVATCREAGIRVIMVTGDHPTTAKAIARTVGIISPESETVDDIAKRLNVSKQSVDPKLAEAVVVTGAELKDMPSEKLDSIFRTHSEIVFARTSPQQKLIIVEGVQRMGCIVAVTGDGVNDSPALRKADIGIAMGITGSDVSKDAAKMILLDDNFASVVIGIEEGRLIFDNLRKTIAYMLTSNIPEIIPFLIADICGIPQAIGTAGILYIDLGTDILPAIAMAYERSETDIMKRPPRDPQHDKIINKKVMGQAYFQIGVLQCLAGYLTYFVVYAENGFFPRKIMYGLDEQWSNEAATDLIDSYGQEWTYYQRRELELTCQGAFFTTIVVTQWVNLINCKCRKMSIFQKGMSNHVINFALIFETILVVILLYVPGVNHALQMRPAKNFWLPGFSGGPLEYFSIY